MRHHRKLTHDERSQIIEARGQGTPVAALARRFGVSPRTIYNTLNRAQASGLMPARTRTVTMRVSEREMSGFNAALAERGITDRPAALRRLMDAAETLLRPADQSVIDRMQHWGAEIATHGAAINHIARKLNEAKLRGRPIPYTAEDAATLRAFTVFFVAFVEEFRARWEAKRVAMTREVDKALTGLATKGPVP